MAKRKKIYIVWVDDGFRNDDMIQDVYLDRKLAKKAYLKAIETFLEYNDIEYSKEGKNLCCADENSFVKLLEFNIKE